jgi:cytosine deaminase
VALGQDDIEDAYSAWGRHNMLEVAFLAGHVLGFRTNEQQRLVVEMVTTRAAAALGIEGHGLAVGDVADSCVHDRQRVVDLLHEHEAPREVYRRGRLVASTSPAVTSWDDRSP